ncbi:MAG: Glu-tRNA(Gln) amidotransferase subunit GatE [Candidatus Woesearchaeota archaeon]
MADYSKLGLRVGLEVHQQLEGKKLFCKCPTIIKESSPDFTILRKLRALPGEVGEVDLAALAEQMKGLSFIYEVHRDVSCLVELDESPPESFNETALRTALQVSLLLKARPVDQVRVMRKIVIDGSNTTGFQRTALVGLDGEIETSQGRIGIKTICLEEDSARIIKEERGHKHIIYRLDRLGIPLIEIGTAADIKSPEQAKEAAEKLGLLLRSTGSVKRGIGTIRQDVNVSITGGERIEIKGCQELGMIPVLVENEVRRQLGLLAIKDELKLRGAKAEAIKKVVPVDVRALLEGTKSKLIQSTIQSNGSAFALKLPLFEGIFGKELQPGRRFGTELSERAAVAAGVGGILHSDELPGYGISSEEKAKVAKALGCGKGDGFVIVVAGHRQQAFSALEAVRQRALEAFEGVPKEVRKANADGSTSYLRPMPGAARMYPETDIPPITITKEMLSGIALPELIEQKIARYRKLGLSKDLAELVAKSDRIDIFERFVNKFKTLKPAYIAELLMTVEKKVKAEFNLEIWLSEEDFESIFSALEKGEISKEAILPILATAKPVKEVLGQFRQLSEKELEKELKALVAEKAGLGFNAVMGIAMSKLRGKAPGQKIAELLKRMLGSSS